MISVTKIISEVLGWVPLQHPPGIAVLPSEQIIRSLLREWELQLGAPELEIGRQRASGQQLGHACCST